MARPAIALAALALALAVAPAAQAGLFGRKPSPELKAAKQAAVNAEAAVREIQRAIDEARLLDAGRMLDDARLSGIKDPRLDLLAGQLNLKRGRYDVALDAFKAAEGQSATRAGALEGQGIALALLDRSDDAMAMLQEAVAANSDSWRAWNALGGEYDKHQDWTHAEEAYARALARSGGAAQVLNNRGYSRLLQGRTDEAVTDLVAALKKDPSMAPARTNLRLAIAMRGEYDQALAGSGTDNRAAALNNAGFAAMMRGEYDRAIDLFQQAMESKGEYYARAQANLQVAKSLQGAKAAAR